MTSIRELQNRDTHICVVGLGYVGIPLAVALNRHFSVYGLDNDPSLIRTLREGVDRRRSVQDCEIVRMKKRFTDDPSIIRQCAFIIVAVPTPISKDRVPDLTPIMEAARAVGRNLSCGSVVVIESTVYPGVTETIVGKIIAEESGWKQDTEFYLGYSPERISPGDQVHRLERLQKVVAGGNDRVTSLMVDVYGTINGGQVHRASSIVTAETAKLLENTQRDVNIALMNEFAIVCDQAGIDIREVIRTAKTKWNFVAFEPGLVGGHCISVDPYYYAYVGRNVGYEPRVALAARQLNDSMGEYIAKKTVVLIRKTNKILAKTKIPRSWNYV